MDKDLIIGVVDNYTWDQIKYWANSIKQSGFDGYKALIVYNMNVPTVKKLTEEGFMLIGCNEYDANTGFTYGSARGSIMVDRFFHIAHFLEMMETPVKNVIITDVRDVVFQDNPTTWLDDNYVGLITSPVLGSENMLYQDEPWSKNNMLQAFGPVFYEKMKERPIYCAGVIAGDVESIRDLCMNLWLVCRGLNPHVDGGGGPDQAALNILMNFNTYAASFGPSVPSDGWVLHAGTSLPAIQAGSGGIGQAYIQNKNMDLKFIEDIEYSTIGDFVRVNGEKVTVLHQWDRVPTWKQMIEAKYGN